MLLKKKYPKSIQKNRHCAVKAAAQFVCEGLEKRRLLSVAVDTNFGGTLPILTPGTPATTLVNVSKISLPAAFTAYDPTLAVDPQKPNDMFVDYSVMKLPSYDLTSMLGKYSTNSGLNWTSTTFNDMVGMGGQNNYTEDADAVFDNSGNLFLAYVGAQYTHTSPSGVKVYQYVVQVAESTNGGISFTGIQQFRVGNTANHVSVAVGKGAGGAGEAIWITWTDPTGPGTATGPFPEVMVTAASVNPTNGNVAPFVTPFPLTTSLHGMKSLPTNNYTPSIPQVAIGANGQVDVAYELQVTNNTGTQSYLCDDIDTSGNPSVAKFSLATPVTGTLLDSYAVPGIFQYMGNGRIAPTWNDINPEVHIAYDDSTSPNDPYKNRLYEVYTDYPNVAAAAARWATNVYL
jgi:hypothetical protein